jgi:hypothetical protein
MAGIEEFINSLPAEEKSAVPNTGGKLPVEEVPQGKLGLQRSFFGAFNETVAALPDAAINVAMYGMEQAGIIPPPEKEGNNRDFLRRVFNAANYDQQEKILGFLSMGTPGTEARPETFGEKLAAGGGQSVAMGAPVLGMQVAGTRGGTYVGEAADAVIRNLRNKTNAAPTVLNSAQEGAQRLAQKSVQQLAERPAAVLAGEVAAGALSGAAGTAEQETLGVRTGIGDLAGGMVGSALPAVVSPVLTTMRKFNVLEHVGRAAKDAKDFITTGEVKPTEAANAKANSRVEKELLDALQRSYDRGDLQTTERILRDIDELGIQKPRMTAAEVTLDSNLAKEQEQLQLAARGKEARANAERIKENRDIGFQYRQKVLDLDPDAAEAMVVREKNRIQSERGALQAESGELDDEWNSAASRVTRLANRNDPLRAQRDKLAKARDAKQKELSDYSDSLGLSNLKGSADIRELKAVANQVFTTGSDSTDKLLPKAIQFVMDLPEDSLTFKGYKAILDKVQDDINAAFASDRGKTAMQLQEFQKGLKEFAKQSFPEQTDIVENFNARYKNEYADPFTKGIVFRLTERENLGKNKTRYVTSDEKMAADILRTENDAKQYAEVFKNDPEAMQSMKNIILDQIAEQGKGSQGSPYSGTIDPTKLNTYLQKNRESLTALGFMDELSDLQKVLDDTATRRQNLEQRSKLLNEEKLTQLIKKYDSGDLSADEVIKNAVTKGNRSTLHQMKNRITALEPEESEPLMKTLKSAVMTQLMDGVDMSDPTAVSKVIDKNKAAIGALWSDAELERAKRVSEFMLRVESASRNEAGRGLEHTGLMKVISESIGISPRAATAEFRAAEQGRTSYANSAVWALTRFLNARSEKAYAHMFTENLINRDMAKDIDVLLQDAAKPGGPTITESAPIWKRIKDTLFDQGYDLRARTYLQNPIAQPSGEPYREPEKTTIDLNEPPPPLPAPKLLGAGNAPFNAPRPGPTAPGPASPEATEPGRRWNEITVTPRPSSPAPGGRTSAPAPDFEALFPNDSIGRSIQQRRQ